MLYGGTCACFYIWYVCDMCVCTVCTCGVCDKCVSMCMYSIYVFAVCIYGMYGCVCERDMGVFISIVCVVYVVCVCAV